MSEDMTEREAFNQEMKRIRDRKLEKFDEGTVGHTTGQLLDELVVEDPDRFEHDDIDVDLKGSMLAVKRHMAREVADAFEAARGVADSE